MERSDPPFYIGLLPHSFEILLIPQQITTLTQIKRAALILVYDKDTRNICSISCYSIARSCGENAPNFRWNEVTGKSIKGLLISCKKVL